MCGVIGLANGCVADKLYMGMCALQHRGQDSCGMITCGRGDPRFRAFKSQGRVYENFSPNQLRNLEGGMGVGHVRYPTVGSDYCSNAQPFFVEGDVNLGLAHNGNLVNFAEMKRKLNAPGITNDAEVILRKLAGAMRSEGDVFPAVQSLMGELNGAYSVAALSPKDGLIAFRDPHAIKPLVLSENGVASENVALDIVGEEVVRDVGPGECVVIKDGVTESRTLVQEKRAHCMFEWVYFSRTDSTIEKVSVYEARLRLGNALASEWEQEADVIVPVPDTARAAAQGFSEATGIPLREGLIKNRYLARSFIMPSQEAREMMVRLKLNPIISELRGKSVALVDDSIVRGTTSKRLVQQVRAAGAKEVHFVVSCPPIRHPCFYGIDMCREDELIARTKAPAEIAKELGADSVTYQGIDGLRKAIGVDGLCTACLNGDYPTDCSAMLSRQGQGCRPYEAE